MLRRFPLRFTIREILLTTGALCVGLAWWLEYSTREETTRICVANCEISTFTEITRDMVGWESRREEEIPTDAVFVPNAAVGLYARSRIAAGEPILSQMLVKDISPGIGVIPPFRVATIKTQMPKGTIQKGDFVNIVQTSTDGVVTVAKHAEVVGIHEMEVGDAWHQISVKIHNSHAKAFIAAVERGKLQVLVERN